MKKIGFKIILTVVLVFTMVLPVFAATQVITTYDLYDPVLGRYVHDMKESGNYIELFQFRLDYEPNKVFTVTDAKEAMALTPVQAIIGGNGQGTNTVQEAVEPATPKSKASLISTGPESTVENTNTTITLYLDGNTVYYPAKTLCGLFQMPYNQGRREDQLIVYNSENIVLIQENFYFISNIDLVHSRYKAHNIFTGATDGANTFANITSLENPVIKIGDEFYLNRQGALLLLGLEGASAGSGNLYYHMESQTLDITGRTYAPVYANYADSIITDMISVKENKNANGVWLDKAAMTNNLFHVTKFADAFYNMGMLNEHLFEPVVAAQDVIATNGARIVQGTPLYFTGLLEDNRSLCVRDGVGNTYIIEGGFQYYDAQGKSGKFPW